jgi:hypothetical protein
MGSLVTKKGWAKQKVFGFAFHIAIRPIVGQLQKYFAWLLSTYGAICVQNIIGFSTLVREKTIFKVVQRHMPHPVYHTQ